MGRIVHLAGQRFGKLLVNEQFRSVRRWGRQQLFWHCRCDCGIEKWVLGELLKQGRAISCGCWGRDRGDENLIKGRLTPSKYGDVKARTREYRAAFYQANKEAINARNLDSYYRHQTERAIAAARRYMENAEERRSDNRRRYRENPGLWIAHTIKRKKALRQQEPKWVDKDELHRIYRECPAGMNVDHIVPLRGRTVERYPVSGLHVPWNLQYLPADENNRKRNKMRAEDAALAYGSTTILTGAV